MRSSRVLRLGVGFKPRTPKLAKILAEEGRWRRSPATAHQDSLAETGKLRTLREGTESIVFVQYGAQGPRPTIRMLTGRSGAATTS